MIGVGLNAPVLKALLQRSTTTNPTNAPKAPTVTPPRIPPLRISSTDAPLQENMQKLLLRALTAAIPPTKPIPPPMANPRSGDRPRRQTWLRSRMGYSALPEDPA